MQNVFVFGSNERGAHSKGAALDAVRYHGAIYGQAVGLQGNSYAIPTRDAHIKTLPLDVIIQYVDNFLDFAELHTEMIFNVTRIGTGLAGYTDEQIEWMFYPHPDNVILPKAWGGKGFDW